MFYVQSLAPPPRTRTSAALEDQGEQVFGQFAIDAVYAGDDGAVVAVERDIPAVDATARCHDGVAEVLEVGGGVASAARAGDRLTR